jgi:NAD(P)-dependent dehydrogenase (short-subunit alcohol dehydrogenase family)
MAERRFAEKTVVITGATSGIGRSCALAFAEAGARIVCVGRNEQALAELSHQLGATGSEVLTVSSDLSLEGEAKKVADVALQRFDRVDVLVNAAGHISSGTIEDTSLEAWDNMMAINVRAVFNLMQAVVPSLIARKGNVVNISSVTGLRAFPGVLAYCVSKAALDQLTRCSALELAPKGVRVNAVNPGVVVTEIHKRGGMTDEKYAAFLEHSKQTHPLGRVGRPEEIASLVLYLASDEASWITGATYSIDGGRAQTCAR